VVDGATDATFADNVTGSPCKVVAADTLSAVVVAWAGCDTVTLTLLEDEAA
jgi:hypothetical protein